MSEENVTLLPCPFCCGVARHKIISQRRGYGEYERSQDFHVVLCEACGAQGRHFRQGHLIEFTSHTVSDFRNNPALRAKVEGEYEAYCKQIKTLAISAWNTRTQPLNDGE